MLLIMCHAGASRYAIDSRHVCEVLPRVALHRLAGSPYWLAGMLVCRAAATPVVDLVQIVEGRDCPERLSSRIVILRIESPSEGRRFGLLAENVELRETHAAPQAAGGGPAAHAALGRLCLDEQGVFQLVDIERLLSEGRREALFSAEDR
jgi:chemotaxis-related protein WspB